MNKNDDLQVYRFGLFFIVYLLLAGAVATGVLMTLNGIYHPYVDPHWPRTPHEQVVHAFYGGIASAFGFMVFVPWMGVMLYAAGYGIGVAWSALTHPWRRPACPLKAVAGLAIAATLSACGVEPRVGFNHGPHLIPERIPEHTGPLTGYSLLDAEAQNDGPDATFIFACTFHDPEDYGHWLPSPAPVRVFLRRKEPKPIAIRVPSPAAVPNFLDCSLQPTAS